MGEVERSKIFRHFGIEAQIKKLHEEVDEVYEAYKAYEASKSEEDREHLIEELGDCRMILAQVQESKRIYDFDVKSYFNPKEIRTLERIEKGYYNVDCEVIE